MTDGDELGQKSKLRGVRKEKSKLLLLFRESCMKEGLMRTKTGSDLGEC